MGVLASIVGVFTVRATEKDRAAMAPINRGFLTAGILTVFGTLAVALVYVGNPDGTVSERRRTVRRQLRRLALLRVVAWGL